uniref:non-specific protein-tyrosine kinase n=1 Tax=Oncorhynchus mykiss TaxID=8022 RepID=A0A8K9XID5_ONCMY
MLPTVILKGTLIKKSQQKRRTSPCNYKERLFVLDTQDLTYSEQRPGKKPTQKGCIELSRIKCVEIVCSEAPIPCSNKYPFQYTSTLYYKLYDTFEPPCLTLYLISLSCHEETKCNALLLKYHPNFWTDGRWRCCYQTEKMAMGCQEYDPVGYGTGIFHLKSAFPTLNKNNNLYYYKNPRVKHYQIRQSEAEETSKFYLAEKYLFMTIPELIQYHQHNAAGLITRLRHPISQGRESFQSPAELSKGQWEVDPAELILGEEVGSGQFGLVLQGRWRERRVAVKMVREGAMSEEDFKEEARVMTMLSHCKLVQLYGVCTQHSPMCLVFELMEQGCLSDYLRARRGRMSQDTLLGMCLDVSEGMAYLESNNFIHRDLAARNCLVSCNNVVKVSDFGMTRFVLDDQYTSSQGSKFPIKWSSPEVIKYCKFSSKSDVWSFGVFMWEVYTEGRLPYENRSNGEVVEALNAGLRLLKPRQAPEAVHLLMEWCWKEKPEDRPSFALLLHELASLSDL